MKKNNENLENKKKEAFALIGMIGGNANFAKNGRKHMSKIGKLGAKKRWKK